MRILHLSDLHFGIKASKERTREEIAVRNFYINDLINGLGSIAKKEPLDYIFITGDMAYTATCEAYKEAGQWLEKISRVCRVPACRIYLCPGDQDIDEDTDANECPENRQMADALLNSENFDNLEKRFQKYNEFCQDAGLPAYDLDGKKNYLTGVAVNPFVNVVCLNTAWFSVTDIGKNTVWVGSGLVDLIKKQKKYANGQPTIAIMHHSQSDWNESERSNEKGSRNVFGEVCKIADMILSGHTHESEDCYGYRNHVYICGNGAVYKGNTYHHNFHIYEWDSNKKEAIDCIRTVYEFNGSTWNKKSEKIKIKSGKRKENNSDKPLKYSFSVLWWTR